MNRKILVVDDDQDIRETIEFILRQAGYSVSICSTGNDILNTVVDLDPDLILLDINLGVLDGRDLCRLIKSNASTSAIPVIMVSGEDDIYNSIIDVCANDVVPKPFTEEVLLNRIARQLSDPGLTFADI